MGATGKIDDVTGRYKVLHRVEVESTSGQPQTFTILNPISAAQSFTVLKHADAKLLRFLPRGAKFASARSARTLA